MAVKILREEELLELIRDSRMSDDLKDPRKCKQCAQTLAARFEEGRLTHFCPLCDDKGTLPWF